MAKRGRSSELTGGTGDVSPQLLSVSLNMSAANTYTSSQVAMPQNKFQASPTHAVVIELLKVFWNLSEVDANPAAGGSLLVAWGQLSTTAKTAIDFGDPKVITIGEKVVRGAFSAGGSYAAVSQDPIVQDLTDGAGHGVLIGTDTAFVAMTTQGYVAAGNLNMKMLYRFKKISLAEYIGVVQSQS